MVAHPTLRIVQPRTAIGFIMPAVRMPHRDDTTGCLWCRTAALHSHLERGSGSAVSEQTDDAEVMTQGPPTVSVVVPTHNRVRLLPLTLHTVLRQQEVALEVIVIDDGSTEDIDRTVRELDDPRVHQLRHGTSQGVSVARNHGVARAQGHWIAFLDDDDLWA